MRYSRAEETLIEIGIVETNEACVEAHRDSYALHLPVLLD